MKKKLLFLHFDLGNGGAENVLVNLLNNLDDRKYDITLRTVFSGGVNRNRLKKSIDYKPLFNCIAKPGTSLLFKFIPNKILHNLFVRDKYDCEIAFLEDIPTRILGCRPKPTGTKRYAWYHNTMDSYSIPFRIYRSKNEFLKVYSTFDKIAFVSNGAMKSFNNQINISIQKEVVHNVCDFERMKTQAKEPINISVDSGVINLCSVGRLCGQKGFKRLMRALVNLYNEGMHNWHLYLIGDGPERNELTAMVSEAGINSHVTFLGFQKNPYKYVSKMDIFVCSSYKEGYSTAVTEAIVLGIPVLTTECSGMDEIFGKSGAGIIVNNSQKGIEDGLRNILNLNAIEQIKFKNNAIDRSVDFTLDARIEEFEKFIGTNTY